MQKGLTLKYDTLDNWADFLKINSHTPFCKVVGKNGKGIINPIVLASLSPLLKELLSSIPPYIDGCIILPDFDFAEISTFLESLSHVSDNFTVTQSLVATLGINLDHFNEITVRNVAKEKLVQKPFANAYEDFFENNIKTDQVESNDGLLDYQEILKDEFSAFKTDNKKNMLMDLPNVTKSDRILNHETDIYVCKEVVESEPVYDNNWMEIYDDKSHDNNQPINDYFKINTNFEEGKNTELMAEDNLYINLNENRDNRNTDHSSSPKICMCSFCPKTFTTRDNAILHENTHDGSVAADEDGMMLKEKLRKRKAKSKKQIVRNAFDEIRKSEIAELTEHINGEESVANLFEKCEFCKKAYVTKSKLRSHQLKYHPDKIESPNTQNTERFKTDVKSKHFKKLNGFICCADEKCMKSFKSIEGAYAHYEGVHIGELVYPCDLCNKSFKSLHGWKDHLREQHYARKDGKVTCELCGGTYVSKKAMRFHKRTYHPEKPQIFGCSYCPKTFRSKNSIWTHENSHTGARRVTCDVCGKSVYSKKGLESHVKNRHEKVQSTETKGVGVETKGRKKLSNSIGYKNDLSKVRFEKQGGRFHCKEPNCFQSMGNHQIAIAHHEEVHIGLPHYPCDQCEKVLTSKSGWEKHKYKDHIKGSDGTVKCEYCGKDWVSEARKRSHIAKYHRDAKKLQDAQKQYD